MFLKKEFSNANSGDAPDTVTGRISGEPGYWIFGEPGYRIPVCGRIFCSQIVSNL
jgi:hypothetical protein